MTTTRLTSLISLILFTGYSLFIVLNGEANLFFIIYLYFLDEVIKNIFLAVKSFRLKALGIDSRGLYNTVKARFFMLFIYSVFIIVVFGLVYGLMITGKSEFTQNVMIFLFKDIYFNISLLIIMIRESVNLLLELKSVNKNTALKIETLNNGMLVLHLSIIFGGVIWFLTSGKFEYFHLSFGKYNTIAIIFPFLIIKFLFDLNGLKIFKNVKVDDAHQ